MGDWEKADRMCCTPRHSSEDCPPKSKSIRSVNPLLKNPNLSSVLWKAISFRRLKLHSLEWWGWSGQSHHIQYFLCSSLMLFTVHFESATALLRDKADEGYHSWNRALLTISRPWSLLPNLLPIWEHSQWVGKRDRGSHQPKKQTKKIQYHWLPVH